MLYRLCLCVCVSCVLCRRTDMCVCVCMYIYLQDVLDASQLHCHMYVRMYASRMNVWCFEARQYHMYVKCIHECR